MSVCRVDITGSLHYKPQAVGISCRVEVVIDVTPQLACVTSQCGAH